MVTVSNQYSIDGLTRVFDIFFDLANTFLSHIIPVTLLHPFHAGRVFSLRPNHALHCQAQLMPNTQTLLPSSVLVFATAFITIVIFIHAQIYRFDAADSIPFLLMRLSSFQVLSSRFLCFFLIKRYHLQTLLSIKTAL